MSEDKNSNQTNEENLKEKLENPETEVETTPETEVEIKKEEIKEKSKHNIKAIAITAIVGIACLGVGFTTGKEEGRKLPATHKYYSSSKVIATVGDTKITGKELKQKMETLFYINGKQKMTDEQIKGYEENMIDYMTTTEVLYLEGKKEKIEVSKKEIESEYANLIQSISQKTETTEKDFLSQSKISKEELEKELEKELIATKYMTQASKVSDKEAKNYYDKNKDEFLKVRASHILILNTDAKGNPVSKEQKKKNKEKAEEILKKAQAGEDFAELAKKYSQDSSASNGGDLDFFGKGQMVEPFEKAAFSLKVGEVNKDVVESQFGYHIIKKTDEKQANFDTVKQELKDKLSQDKQNNLVADLVKKYKVDVKK